MNAQHKPVCAHTHTHTHTHTHIYTHRHMQKSQVPNIVVVTAKLWARDLSGAAKTAQKEEEQKEVNTEGGYCKLGDPAETTDADFLFDHTK